MAGLQESCSHVGATLFYIKTAFEVVSGETCTFAPCSWLEPSAVKVDFLEIIDIDFTAPGCTGQLLESTAPKPVISVRPLKCKSGAESLFL